MLYPSPIKAWIERGTLSATCRFFNMTTSREQLSDFDVELGSSFEACGGFLLGFPGGSEALKVTIFRFHSFEGSPLAYTQVLEYLSHFRHLGRVSSH